MLDLKWAKTLSMVGLGTGSMLAGLLPVWLSRTSRWSPRNSLFRSALLCFGGGVLLSTSLIHMLSESRVALKDNADIAFCAGFLFIYFVDEFFHLFYGRAVDDLGRSYQSAVIAENPHRNYGSNDTTTLLVRSEPLVGNEPMSSGCHVHRREPCTNSAAGRGGLLFALSIHTILEGLAIGLQDTTTKVLLLLGAVASHKLVVAFCLGAELISVENAKIWMNILAVSIFSFGSALGIGIGMVVEASNEYWTETALGIMQALAGGTLLYVTLSEVLPRERARWHSGPRYAGSLQFSATTIGFLFMYFLNKYFDHDDRVNTMVEQESVRN